MIKIGMMIGDRYEVLEKIGTGGMSDVYKAKCHKLNRFVAVKVLKQEFSENANFVSKFRTEAQAAAGLMHPNIVNVYDVGEEKGIHYIVMELVEGITLKKYIEKKARLSFKETVSIAIQVSMGIEAAHNNHIIHRDIKPQNIIISKDGKVKVTDFGIAKAATSNTITSNVMGSVHYTSPEQARGGYSDEKSDIYSLGITMFEMLTGRVPFNGETTVAIAIKHIQEELPSPKEFVPEIPSSIEGIVLKCCQKSPDRRYQNMQDLISDLKQSLINPDMDLAVMADPDMEAGTRTITDSDMRQIKQMTAYQGEQDYGGGEEYDSPYPETDEVYEEEEEPEDGDEYDYNPKTERIATLLAVVMGIIILLVVGFLIFNVVGFGGDDDGQGDSQSSSNSSSQGSGTEARYVKMPVVRGKSVEDARSELKELGIETDVEYEESDVVEPGKVISANVAVGEDVQVGGRVILTASAMLEEIEVPKVTEIGYKEAEEQLMALGFNVTREEDHSDEVEEGIVMDQFPPEGTMADEGANITITVSLGKGMSTVPLLVGKKEQEGISDAVAEGLEIGEIIYEYNDAPEYGEGVIFYQSCSVGISVEPGTVVDIKVSKGPQVFYKFTGNISAPTAEEAPDYVAGTDVSLALVTDSGQILLETRTASFPQTASYYGLTAPYGTLMMTYTVTTGGTTSTDPNTGETVNIPGTTESRSFTRRVEFTPE